MIKVTYTVYRTKEQAVFQEGQLVRVSTFTADHGIYMSSDPELQTVFRELETLLAGEDFAIDNWEVVGV